MEARFKVRTKATTDLLRRIPARIIVEVHDALEQMAQLHQANMVKRMRRGQRSSMGFAQQTQTLTGRLARSIQYVSVSAPATLAQVRTRVFVSGVPYAEIQELGGVVVPKRAKYLAIPMPAVKTASGVPRYASPRDYPGKTFVMRDRKGGLWIAEQAKAKKRGKNMGGAAGGINLLWKLAKSVRIRGNLNWMNQWRSDAEQRRRILNSAVRRAIDAAVRR